MRALLPAAGAGRRADPLTRARPKCLLDVEGEPLIVRALNRLRDELGVEEVVVVVGHEADQVRAAVAGYPGLRIHCVDCPDPDVGLARGMLLAEPHLHGPFVTLLPDEVHVDANHRDLPGLGPGTLALCGALPDGDPAQIAENYALEADGTRVTRLVEKPTAPTAGWLGCGTFVFAPEVFDAIRRARPSARSGKVELVDVLDQELRAGARVELFELRGGYVNVNTVADWHRATDLVRSQGAGTLSVIVPALEEEDSIAEVVTEFLGRADEVLVIDNHSTDRTAERARSAGATVRTVSVKGYGDALRYGLDHALGERLVLVEADHSFRAADLDRLLAPLAAADMVMGTRTSRQFIVEGAHMGPGLRLGNRAVGALIGALWPDAGVRFTDVGCTYRALWRSTWRTMRGRALADGPAFSPEMMIEALRDQRRVVEVPVEYHPRLGGDSKHSGSLVATSRTAAAMLALIARKRLGRAERDTQPLNAADTTSSAASALRSRA